MNANGQNSGRSLGCDDMPDTDIIDAQHGFEDQMKLWCDRRMKLTGVDRYTAGLKIIELLDHHEKDQQNDYSG